MRVLVTGHNGYIGTVLVPLLEAAGHHVVGLDTDYFRECTLRSVGAEVPSIKRDIRDVSPSCLIGFDALVHLAALSNDPLGNLNPDLTYEINHRASVNLAWMAKSAGVSRFVFASSCSLYGASGDDFLTEEAAFNPVTPYGASKIKTEEEVAQMADESFSPTFLRNATAYGYSDRLRCDLVVNNLTGYAFLTGEALIKSDGLAWRPLVHVEDIARAFVAAIEAPRDVVHNQAFNVGRTSENYLIKDVARIVGEVTGAEIAFAGGGSADTRNYRVDCSKIARLLPGFQPKWTVRSGVEQLYAAFQQHGLTMEDFAGPRFQRIRKVRELIQAGRIDADLHWKSQVLMKAGA